MVKIKKSGFNMLQETIFFFFWDPKKYVNESK